jgi:hypothetical protein
MMDGIESLNDRVVWTLKKPQTPNDRCIEGVFYYKTYPLQKKQG